MEALSTTPILVEQVRSKLVDAIMDGTLPPGQRILQADLAARLAVSRQPISHALQILKQQGLVQDAGRKGLEISPIDPVRIRQLYEVRASLDVLAAELAAERIRGKDAGRNEIDGLSAILEKGENLEATSTNTYRVDLDLEFHKAIYDLSGNPMIFDLIAHAWLHIKRSMHAVLEDGRFRARVWVEHQDIGRCILGGDAAGAKQAAYAHAMNAGLQTEKRLQRQTAMAKRQII